MHYQLYDLAYQMYKAKPWKQLRATDIFAIPLTGGRTGYVCISSTDDPEEEEELLHAGSFEFNLSLLPGQESLDMFRAGLLQDYPDMGDRYLHKRRLMLFYAGKEDMRGHEAELAALREYEKQAGHKFPKDICPVFVSEEPYRMGNSYLQQAQEEDLAAAIRYTLEMLTELQFSDKKTLGFTSFALDGSQQTIPMIEQINGLYRIRPLEIPALEEQTYPPVIADNELLVHTLSKRKKTGTLYCQLCGVLTPDFENENFVFPMMIFAASSKDVTEPVSSEKAFDYEKHPENLLNLFLQRLFNTKPMPKKLVVRDARTAAFLEDTARRIGCSLEVRKDLPVLDEAIEYYMAEHGIEDDEEDPEEISQQEILETMQMLADLPDSLFNRIVGRQQIPQEMIDQFHSMEEQNLVSREMADVLNRILERLDALHGKSGKKSGKPGSTAGDKKTKPQGRKSGQGAKSSPKKKDSGRNQKSSPINPESAQEAGEPSARSYIVSVSLGTGCYCHLRVPTDIPLDELAMDIVDAFYLDDDHMYSFFMDNKAWSKEAEYTSSIPGDKGETLPDEKNPSGFFDEAKPAEGVPLEDALCRADGKFLFLYDFGDEWRFSCRILRELNEPTDFIEIVRRKGMPPGLYPYA